MLEWWLWRHAWLWPWCKSCSKLKTETEVILTWLIVASGSGSALNVAWLRKHGGPRREIWGSNVRRWRIYLLLPGSCNSPYLLLGSKCIYYDTATSSTRLRVAHWTAAEWVWLPIGLQSRLLLSEKTCSAFYLLLVDCNLVHKKGGQNNMLLHAWANEMVRNNMKSTMLWAHTTQHGVFGHCTVYNHTIQCIYNLHLPHIVLYLHNFTLQCIVFLQWIDAAQI